MLSTSGKSSKRVLTIGLVADVQYCDCEDAMDFSGKQLRRYRNSLEVLKFAIKEFNQLECQHVIQLGDLIDGKNKQNKQSMKAFNTVMNEFKEMKNFNMKYNLHHLIGNHDLYNFNFKQLYELFHPHGTYYTFSPYKYVKFIMLNPYAISTIDKKHNTKANIDKATELLNENNPNDWQTPGANWKKGLTRKTAYWVPYNGAIGEEQLDFLAHELEKSKKLKEKVFICSHICLTKDVNSPSCLIFDHEVVTKLIENYNDTITACFYGHDHPGFYRHVNNIHHCTIASPLNTNDKYPSAHASLQFFSSSNTDHEIDRIELVGSGLQKSVTLFDSFSNL